MFDGIDADAATPHDEKKGAQRRLLRTSRPIHIHNPLVVGLGWGDQGVLGVLQRVHSDGTLLPLSTPSLSSPPCPCSSYSEIQGILALQKFSRLHIVYFHHASNP